MSTARVLRSEPFRVLPASELSLPSREAHRRGTATLSLDGVPPSQPCYLPFGPLRLCGLERFEEGYEGFAMHPHQDVEVVTVMVRGAFRHRDNLGRTGRVEADEVQVMSAGSGIEHEEMPEGTPCIGIQMMFDPRTCGPPPTCRQGRFPRSERQDCWTTLVSGDGVSRDGEPRALAIDQDVIISSTVLREGATVERHLGPDRRAYLLVVEGRISVEGTTLELHAHDRLLVDAATILTLRALEAAEALLIEL